MSERDRILLTRFGPGVVPRPEHRVHRPRLTALIHSRPDARVVVLQGPAGAGKTTAAWDWAQSAPHPVGWLSLREADRDPRKLAAYLAEALARACPAIAERRPLPSKDASLQALLAGPINVLAETGNPCGLVVDDMHQVARQPAMAEVVRFLADEAPPGFRLLLTTRGGLPAGLHLPALLAKGAACILGPDDLKFTPDEIAG